MFSCSVSSSVSLSWTLFLPGIIIISFIKRLKETSIENTNLLVYKAMAHKGVGVGWIMYIFINEQTKYKGTYDSLIVILNVCQLECLHFMCFFKSLTMVLTLSV